MRRWLAAVVLTAASASLLAACGLGSSSGLSASAAHNLRLSVENVRQAAHSGSYSQLQRAVALLKDLVNREEQSGDVSSERANEILDAAGILLTDAKPKPSPTPSATTPPTTTTIPSPTPTPSATSASPSPTVSPSTSQSPIVHISALMQPH
jgi:hypothetical protein